MTIDASKTARTIASNRAITKIPFLNRAVDDRIVPKNFISNIHSQAQQTVFHSSPDRHGSRLELQGSSTIKL
jgi:hypothetical protein